MQLKAKILNGKKNYFTMKKLQSSKTVVDVIKFYVLHSMPLKYIKQNSQKYKKNFNSSRIFRAAP